MAHYFKFYKNPALNPDNGNVYNETIPTHLQRPYGDIAVSNSGMKTILKANISRNWNDEDIYNPYYGEPYDDAVFIDKHSVEVKDNGRGYHLWGGFEPIRKPKYLPIDFSVKNEQFFSEYDGVSEVPAILSRVVDRDEFGREIIRTTYSYEKILLNPIETTSRPNINPNQMPNDPQVVIKVDSTTNAESRLNEIEGAVVEGTSLEPQDHQITTNKNDNNGANVTNPINGIVSIIDGNTQNATPSNLENNDINIDGGAGSLDELYGADPFQENDAGYNRPTTAILVKGSNDNNTALNIDDSKPNQEPTVSLEGNSKTPQPAINPNSNLSGGQPKIQQSVNKNNVTIATPGNQDINYNVNTQNQTNHIPTDNSNANTPPPPGGKKAENGLPLYFQLINDMDQEINNFQNNLQQDQVMLQTQPTQQTNNYSGQFGQLPQNSNNFQQFGYNNYQQPQPSGLVMPKLKNSININQNTNQIQSNSQPSSNQNDTFSNGSVNMSQLLR